MRLRLSDLWRWTGAISRGPFLVWALLLFAIKYNLDRLVLLLAFGRHWSMLSYIDRSFPTVGNLLPGQSPREYATLMALSLPFLWAGVVLCLKRLRSARLPGWLTVLFVLPILKWILFVALAVVGDRTAAANPRTSGIRWLPSSALGSAALAMGISALLGLLAAAVCTVIAPSYGWSLFVGTPFSMGFFGALIHGAAHPRRVGESLLVAVLAVTLTGALFLAVAFEGAICLLMAAPLALVLAVLGALAGHAVLLAARPGVPPQIFCVPILAVPLMAGAEHLRPTPAPLLRVVTQIEVKAPIGTVWQHVVEFTELPPPKEFLFKLGIAYPLRAEIHGHGPGAVRHCVFSTGPFVEPIEVWDEPRLLKFSVTTNPAPMEEWTPYHQVHPPHLKGFLVSEKGQFQLTPLPGRRTLLQGTTWYRHNMWPVGYWRLWSDFIIHVIHRRVLDHVKRLSEAEPSHPQAP